MTGWIFVAGALLISPLAFMSGFYFGRAAGIRWSASQYKPLVMDCVKKINELTEEAKERGND